MQLYTHRWPSVLVENFMLRTNSQGHSRRLQEQSARRVFVGPQLSPRAVHAWACFLLHRFCGSSLWDVGLKVGEQVAESSSQLLLWALTDWTKCLFKTLTLKDGGRLLSLTSSEFHASGCSEATNADRWTWTYYDSTKPSVAATKEKKRLSEFRQDLVSVTNHNPPSASQLCQTVHQFIKLPEHTPDFRSCLICSST